ncbi:hypothetical protein ACMFMG_006504 [Clarireedia jacksonii]
MAVLDQCDEADMRPAQKFRRTLETCIHKGSTNPVVTVISVVRQGPFRRYWPVDNSWPTITEQTLHLHEHRQSSPDSRSLFSTTTFIDLSLISDITYFYEVLK